MSITIQVAPELETTLRQKAANTGLAVDQFVAQFLERNFPSESSSKSVVSKREAALLEKINLPFSPEFWADYQSFKEKQRLGVLSESENADFTKLAEQIEVANAKRMKTVLELAKIHNVTLREMMQKLGIRAESHV